MTMTSGYTHISEMVKPVLVQTPVAKTATFQSSSVDRSKFNQLLWNVLIGAASPDAATLDLKVQDSPDNSVWTDLAASTQINFGAVVLAQIDGLDDNKLFEFITDLRKAEKWVRLSGAIAGSSPSFLVGITGILAANVEGLPV